jgi:hypothetical protein
MLSTDNGLTLTALLIASGASRLVGDTDTGRDHEAGDLLSSGLRVVRSVTRCDIALTAKIHRRRIERKQCAVIASYH